MTENKKSLMYEVEGKRTPTWNPFCGCNFDCAYCLTGDTLILMADYSWQTISSIKRGDKIITISDHPINGRRRIEIATVTNLFSRNADCIEVTTKHSVITGSAEHPVLVNSGRWQKLSNLKLSWNLNLISLPTSSPDENEGYIKGYITGITEGDGTFSFTEKEITTTEKQRYWRVALINIPMLKRLQKYLKKLNVDLEIRFFSKGKNHPLFKLESRKYDVLVKIKSIMETIPDSDFKKGFLAGIYDAEGSFDTANLRIANYDSELRRKVMQYGQDVSLDFYEEVYNGYCRGLRLRGGQFENVRFFCMVNPTKKKHISLKRLVSDPIQSLKYVGEHEVYNLETSSHTYIANGYVVHNCYGPRVYKRFSKCEKCKTFTPHFHKERLKQKFKPGETWFVCSMGDISFASFDQFADIIAVINNYPETTFYIQSKNPAYFAEFLKTYSSFIGFGYNPLYGKTNVVLGTTIETNYLNLYLTESVSKAPTPLDRLTAMIKLDHPRKYVSVEPEIMFCVSDMTDWIKKIAPEFVYIGYDNHKSLETLDIPEPTLEDTEQLIEELSKFTEVRLKTTRPAWWEKE